MERVVRNVEHFCVQADFFDDNRSDGDDLRTGENGNTIRAP